MYFSSIESNRAAMAKHNETLRANSKARLAHVKLAKMKGDREGFKRIECLPNRKSDAKLEARVADWQRSIDDPLNRSKNMSGYNKPGSVKFH